MAAARRYSDAQRAAMFRLFEAGKTPVEIAKHCDEGTAGTSPFEIPRRTVHDIVTRMAAEAEQKLAPTVLEAEGAEAVERFPGRIVAILHADIDRLEAITTPPGDLNSHAQAGFFVGKPAKQALNSQGLSVSVSTPPPNGLLVAYGQDYLVAARGRRFSYSCASTSLCVLVGSDSRIFTSHGAILGDHEPVRPRRPPQSADRSTPAAGRSSSSPRTSGARPAPDTAASVPAFTSTHPRGSGASNASEIAAPTAVSLPAALPGGHRATCASRPRDRHLSRSARPAGGQALPREPPSPPVS
jgi:hypothetical protein